MFLFHDISAEYARDRQLRGFAGTVAHDLKGPLTALSGWVEAAADEIYVDDTAAGRQPLARAHAARRRSGDRHPPGDAISRVTASPIARA